MIDAPDEAQEADPAWLPRYALGGWPLRQAGTCVTALAFKAKLRPKTCGESLEHGA